MNSLTLAARSLRKNQAFSITVILTLALGLGANITIFSLVNAVLLRPLPYLDPDDLVVLIGNIQRQVVERRGGSLPDYADWRARHHSFEDLAAYWSRNFVMRTADEGLPVDGEVIGASYLKILGVKPVLGRGFRPAEETDSALPPVAMIGHDLWAQRMGSSVDAVGKTVTLNASVYTIIGVLPPGFRGIGDRAQVWIPQASQPQSEQGYRERGTRGLNVLGRLRRGVTLAQAQADMDGVARALQQEYPGDNDKRGVEVASLVAETVGNIRPALAVLLGAVGLVLLIACANVSNLILLRTESRQAEMSVRAALGASRAALLKLITLETLLLSAAGAAAGLLLASGALDLVIAISPIQLPSFVNVTLDKTVVLFTIGLAGATTIMMALAPALQFTRSGASRELRGGSGRTTSSQSTTRLRTGLVIAEVALSFVVLLTAGLLVESFRHLLRVDPGFSTSNLLTMQLVLDGNSAAKTRLVAEAIEGMPEVKSVAFASVAPFSGGGAIFYSAEGAPSVVDATAAPRALIHFVTPGFFQTMGIPFRSGRDFVTTEGDQSVIVSEKLAQRFWPGQDPIGKRIRPGRNNPENPWRNIVGVVAEAKTRGIPENPTADPDVYFTFGQFGGNPRILVRTETGATSLIPAIVSQIKSIDKRVAISNISTVEQLMQSQTARAQFLSSLSAVFSGLALVLALVGIYGLLSYTVAQRTREIGIRVALGADRSRLIRMVLGRSLVLLVAGLALGLVASLFVSQSISSLLFGVTTTAPSVFLGVSLLMVGAGLAAAYLPALRAARVNPLTALRQI